MTGATKGIGRATALLFGSRGAHVVVHGRDPASAERVVREIADAGGRASIVLADLREAEACERLMADVLATTERVDVLVNNAGANVFKGTMNATIADWNNCLDLDLRAVWLCSREAARGMRPGSSIVNVSSNHATSTLEGVFPYNVAKAGVNALTQSLAIELADRQIRVNTVAPGYIDTPINDKYFGTFADPEGERVNVERLHLSGRLGRPEEIAQAIEFLADSGRSGFTTGTVMSIDGGRSTLLQDDFHLKATNQRRT
ncbi:SDR family oxidoreductase [Saxibacter everestensis]|uniref:SDR family oxidoreductase n=1 Tax=Saxibacter everestensis TaxID=2909229 RepID=A0ABY8QXJ2_9MICO|nr:SDR family oxidoreductase [Brevibacteriaceae bacterium ZFBP1038]